MIELNAVQIPSLTFHKRKMLGNIIPPKVGIMNEREVVQLHRSTKLYYFFCADYIS